MRLSRGVLWGAAAALALAAAFPAAAEDTVEDISIGFGGEVNRYTREILAAGGVFNWDLALNPRVSLGARLALYHDLSEAMTVEAGVLLRWNFYSGRILQIFAQADVGGCLPLIESDLFVSPLAGAALGLRLRGRSMYAEPYIRAGYPFLAGGGVLFGFRV